jgi:hypothetical protein
MPRYYFTIEEDGIVLHDECGEICSDPKHAEEQARKAAVDMIRHGFADTKQINRIIEVREEGGAPFVRVRVIAIVEVERLKPPSR